MAAEYSASAISIAGISINVPNHAGYVSALAGQCVQEFPSLVAIVGGDHSGASESKGVNLKRVLGHYSRSDLRALLYKDWPDSNDNEVDVLCKYLCERALVEGHEHVAVLGSGLGGVVRGLHDAGVNTVDCYDLSWFALYCSRLMLTNRTESLPPEMSAPLFEFAASRDGRSFSRRSVHVPFRCVRFRDNFSVTFAVDSFCVARRFAGSVLLFCNALGALRGAHGRSMFIQCLRSQGVDQVVVFLNWLAGEDSTPDELVALIERGGGNVTFADLVVLPYSAVSFIARGNRSEFLNYAMRIERKDEFDDRRVVADLGERLRKYRAALTAVAPVMKRGEMPELGPVEAAICSLVARNEGCRLSEVLDGEVAWPRRVIEWHVGSLVSRGLLELRFEL